MSQRGHSHWPLGCLTKARNILHSLSATAGGRRHSPTNRSCSAPP